MGGGGQAADWEQELDARFEREYPDDARRIGQKDSWRNAQSEKEDVTQGKENEVANPAGGDGRAHVCGTNWEQELDRSATQLIRAERSSSVALAPAPTSARWEFEIDESVAREAQHRFERHLLRSREKYRQQHEESAVVVQPDWQEWGEKEKKVFMQAAKSLRDEVGVSVSYDTNTGGPKPSMSSSSTSSSTARSSSPHNGHSSRGTSGNGGNGRGDSEESKGRAMNSNERAAVMEDENVSGGGADSGAGECVSRDSKHKGVRDGNATKANDGDAVRSPSREGDGESQRESKQNGNRDDDSSNPTNAARDGTTEVEQTAAAARANGNDASGGGGGGGGCCVIQ